MGVEQELTRCMSEWKVGRRGGRAAGRWLGGMIDDVVFRVGVDVCSEALEEVQGGWWRGLVRGVGVGRPNRWLRSSVERPMWTVQK